MFWDLLAFTVSLLTAIQLFPQTITALKTKKLHGVSLTTFLVIILTSSLWIMYGIHRNDFPIIFANSCILLCAIIIVYRKSVSKK